MFAVLNQPPFVASTRSDEELPVLIQVSAVSGLRRPNPQHAAHSDPLHAAATQRNCVRQRAWRHQTCRTQAMCLQIFRMCGKPTASSWPALADPATFSRPYDDAVFPQIPEGAFSARFVQRLQAAHSIEAGSEQLGSAALEELQEMEIDFIKKCLQVVPSQRATADELLAHPFLQTTSSAAGGGSSSGALSPVARDCSAASQHAPLTSRTAGSVSWGLPAAREGALSTDSAASVDVTAWAAGTSIAPRSTCTSSGSGASPALLEQGLDISGASGTMGRVSLTRGASAAGADQARLPARPLPLPPAGRSISLIPAVDEHGTFLGMVCPEDVMAGRPRHEIAIYKPVPVEAVQSAQARAEAQAAQAARAAPHMLRSLPGGTGIVDDVTCGAVGRPQPTVTATTSTGVPVWVAPRGTSTRRQGRQGTSTARSPASPASSAGSVFGGAKRRRHWPPSAAGQQAAAGGGRYCSELDNGRSAGAANRSRAVTTAPNHSHALYGANESLHHVGASGIGQLSAGKRSRASPC